MMTRLDQPDWLTSAATKKVVAALEAARPGCARFVGGCVRNELMGRPVDDIDIATQLVPEDVIRALKAASIRAVPTGIEHGTVTAVCEGVPYEITTLRRDVETDGRRAVVAFTEDWQEDAMRRDFRCNALYAEPDGTVHDPVGGGIADAAKGRVIFIGDADQRLREDYLRILRFFRFNAWYGAGLDKKGVEACMRQKDGLRQIAAERIWKELHKLLLADNPVAALRAMEETGVLPEVLPNAVPTDRLTELVPLVHAAGVEPDPIARLMMLIMPLEDAAQSVSDLLRLSNVDRARLENWVTVRRSIGGKILAQNELRRAFYKHGTQAVLDYLIWRNPGNEGLSPFQIRGLVVAATEWRRPDFPLKGADALEAGLKGPAIGQALRAVEENWIASDFNIAREVLLKQLAAMA